MDLPPESLLETPYPGEQGDCFCRRIYEHFGHFPACALKANQGGKKLSTSYQHSIHIRKQCCQQHTTNYARRVKEHKNPHKALHKDNLEMYTPLTSYRHDLIKEFQIRPS